MPNQWNPQAYNETDLDPTNGSEAEIDSTGLTGGQLCYWPFALMPPVAGSTTADHTYGEHLHNPFVGNDFEYTQESADLLVRKYPKIAMDLSDMLPINADASTARTSPDMDIANVPIPKEDSGPIFMGTMGSTVKAGTSGQIASTSSPLVATPRTSRGRACRPHYFFCVECGEYFDRASRARDCAYKDLGQTPYNYEGKCKRSNCAKAYSSEALLKEHLAERFTPCPQCGKTISKKNLARHMQEVCY